MVIYSWFSIRSSGSLRLGSQLSRLRQMTRQMIVYFSNLSLGKITFKELQFKKMFNTHVICKVILLFVFLLSKICVRTIFPSGQGCSHPKRYSVAQPILLGNFGYSWTKVFHPISASKLKRTE